MIKRLGEVLYWLGLAFAGIAIVIGTFFAIMDSVESVFVGLVCAFIAYWVAWLLRYILSGEKSHFLNWIDTEKRAAAKAAVKKALKKTFEGSFIISAIIISSIGASYVAKNLRGNGPSLQEVEKALNQNLPMMVDTVTRLDKIRVTHNLITYNYTLTDDEIAKAILSNTQLYSEELKEQIISNMCGAKSDFSAKGNETLYRYYDKNGILLSQIPLKPSDCN